MNLLEFSIDAVMLAIPCVITWLITKNHEHEKAFSLRREVREVRHEINKLRADAVSCGVAQWIPDPQTGIGKFEFKTVERQCGNSCEVKKAVKR